MNRLVLFGKYLKNWFSITNAFTFYNNAALSLSPKLGTHFDKVANNMVQIEVRLQGVLYHTP